MLIQLVRMRSAKRKFSRTLKLLALVVIVLQLVTIQSAYAAEGWLPTVIVDSGSGSYTGLAVVNGNPAISYYDEVNRNLKYVRATDASGAAWATPIVVDSANGVGLSTSLAVINGHPAISYYDSTNYNLKYVRATDANGSTWGTPVIVDNARGVGEYNNLVVVNGNPAISYYDGLNQDLKYVRATDANGSTWGTPITVDSTGDVGVTPSLAVVNGNPAISYSNNSNGELKYVRAADVNGASWNTPIIIDSWGSFFFTSLAVVNGNPAVSYQGGLDALLKYVRANNSNGTTWGAPITVDDAGSVGDYSSLAVINGNPAIGYQDGGNSDLKYVRATDVNGTAWARPQTLDSVGDVGAYTSLKLVNGHPAISYQGSLRYITVGNIVPITGLHAINSSPTLLGNATILTATLSAGTYVTYQWNFGDGQSGTGATVVHTYRSVGAYTATVAATNNLSGTSATTPVMITDVPISGLQIANSSPTQLGKATVFLVTISAGTNVTYQWDFGDGQTGSGATMAHTYAKVGQYTAVVTATNSLSSMVATTPVTITDGPVSSLHAVNSGPTQLGKATVFTATIGSGTHVVYVWDFGDGQSGSGASTTHTYAAIGAYTASVTATNSLGSVTSTTAVTVTDMPVSGLQATNSGPTQLGNTIVFTATISAGTNVTYQWSFGDGQGSSGVNVTHTYAKVGQYTVVLTATNSLGSVTTTLLVTITDAPVSGLHAKNSSPTQLGNTTLFTATIGSGSNVVYVWDFGDGESGSDASTMHTYVAADAYIAMVTATNSLGSVTATTPVTITGVHQTFMLYLPVIRR